MQPPRRPALALALLLLALLAGPTAARPGKLPSSMPVCHKSDQELNACLRNAISASIPELVKGIPKLGLPPIDPLRIQHLHMENGGGSVNLKLTLSDFDIVGIQDVEILKVDADLSRPIIRFEATIPRLQLDGPYKGDGKVLVLPIVGEGIANFTLENARFSLEVSGNFLEKGGRRYFDAANFSLKIRTKHLKINLENLFNGDKTLGPQINQFLNENSADIFAELNQPLDETFSQALQHIAQRLFGKVPFDDIFPD